MQARQAISLKCFIFGYRFANAPNTGSKTKVHLTFTRPSPELYLTFTGHSRDLDETFTGL